MEFDLDAIMDEVQEEHARGSSDVVTIAKELRAGERNVSVEAAGNGFIILISGERPVVAMKPGDVGLLLRTLYSSDLKVEGNVVRIRRLMGRK